MALSKELPILTFRQMVEAIKACYRAKARLAPLMFGDPGVGKSSLVSLVAEELGLPLYVLIGSTCDPTDVGGIPCVLNGTLQRIPIKQIQEAMVRPAILFLDELTAMPAVTQAPMMRGLLEGRFGDLEIHTDSFVVGAANEPDQAPGAADMAATTGNRVIQMVLKPTLDEVADYFRTLGPEGSPLRTEAMDWAVTLSADPKLVKMSPPTEAVEKGTPWPSPRAWERGLRAWVAAGADLNNPVARAVLGGATGVSACDHFIGIRRLRDQLPTVEEICQHPEKARLPASTAQIAAMGVLARVCEKDSGASWIYACRMKDEVGMATTRMLLNLPETPTRFGESARKAKYALLARIRGLVA